MLLWLSFLSFSSCPSVPLNSSTSSPSFNLVPRTLAAPRNTPTLSGRPLSISAPKRAGAMKVLPAPGERAVVTPSSAAPYAVFVWISKRSLTCRCISINPGHISRPAQSMTQSPFSAAAVSHTSSIMSSSITMSFTASIPLEGSIRRPCFSIVCLVQVPCLPN